MSHNTVGQDFKQGVLGDSSVPCGIGYVTWWYLLADELVWKVQDSCTYISVTLLETAGRLVPAGMEHLCLAFPAWFSCRNWAYYVTWSLQKWAFQKIKREHHVLLWPSPGNHITFFFLLVFLVTAVTSPPRYLEKLCPCYLTEGLSKNLCPCFKTARVHPLVTNHFHYLHMKDALILFKDTHSLKSHPSMAEGQDSWSYVNHTHVWQMHPGASF